jgi:hypothetical protein
MSFNVEYWRQKVVFLGGGEEAKYKIYRFIVLILIIIIIIIFIYCKWVGSICNTQLAVILLSLSKKRSGCRL